MFRLHDKTRRRICLAGFFLFCVAPTLGAAAWCAMRHMPWTASDEAKTLGRQLGLEVRLAGLKNLRPGVVLYEDFELADPETGQCLFRSRLLEVQWKTIADGQGSGKPVLALLGLATGDRNRPGCGSWAVYCNGPCRVKPAGRPRICAFRPAN